MRDANGGEPVAAALAVVATLPFIHRGVAYVKFGPLWRRRGEPMRPHLLRAALAAVQQQFAIEEHLVLRVMPPVDPEALLQWPLALHEMGFSKHAEMTAPERYLVDLTLSEAEQRASLDAKWRANLNKAAKLDIREVHVASGLGDFLALYQTMLARKQFDDRHGVKSLPAFVGAASAGLGVRLVLAFHDGAPVAGSLLVGGGDRVFVPFSASGERAPALRAGYALRWWIINRLRGSGARWLDLGGDEGDAGLRSFKTGNVGKRGAIVPLVGEFDYGTNALSLAATSALTAARTLALRWPFVAAMRAN